MKGYCTVGPYLPHSNAFKRLVSSSREFQHVCLGGMACWRCIELAAGQHATTVSLSETALYVIEGTVVHHLLGAVS